MPQVFILLLQKTGNIFLKNKQAKVEESMNSKLYKERYIIWTMKYVLICITEKKKKEQVLKTNNFLTQDVILQALQEALKMSWNLTLK